MAGRTRLEIDRTVTILKNDQQLNTLLVSYSVSLTDQNYRVLANLFLDNEEHLKSNSVIELISETPPFLRQDIATVLNKEVIGISLYQQFLYTFKYATLKNFFRENYDNFLPDYEVLNIQSKEKVKILQEAFMQEFDKFAFIIDKMYDLNDVNSIPTEYLNYMAQTLGYEREDRELLGDASFRELIKNIIEVYQIKGTNFSFELFFNFLGFEANVIEYWFDKRFYDIGISSNPYTAEINTNSHRYYLTPFKPTRYIPEGMVAPYVVSENQVVGTLDTREFDRIAGDEYSLEQLFGDSPGYPGTPFTFFKTNIMEYNLTSINRGDNVEEETGGLTTEQLEIINRYAEFLTPIFISKNVRITILPFEGNAGALIPTDDRRPDPRAKNYKNTVDDPFVTKDNNERFFHLYQGYFPTRYYWEDGVTRYRDPIPYPDGQPARWTGNTSIEPGGHFISGYYNNTYDAVWNKTSGSNSIYDQISTLNPFWDDEEILSEISNRIASNNLFSTYNNPEYIERDLIYPYLDQKVDYPFITTEFTNLFEGSKKTLGHTGNTTAKLQRGHKYRLSDNQVPSHYPSLYNKATILSIVADNGNGEAEITIRDTKRKFNFFKGNMAIAKDWVPKEYEVNEIRKGSNNYLYVCTTVYDGSADASLEDGIENWQILPNEFDKFKGNKIEGIEGDLTAGSRVIENIKFSYQVAPPWEPVVYEEGDLRRNTIGIVYICTTAYDGSADASLEDSLSNWSIYQVTSVLEVGMKIYNEDLLFQAEILEIVRTDSKITLDVASPITRNFNDFVFLKNDKIVISVYGSASHKNNGIYKVIDASSSVVSEAVQVGDFYDVETVLTLDEPLKYNQLTEGGFIRIYAEEWKLRNPRYPLFFNVLDVKGFRNGIELELPYEPNAVEQVGGTLQPIFGVDAEVSGSVSETDIDLE